jgi:hypothetical protein
MTKLDYNRKSLLFLTDDVTQAYGFAKDAIGPHATVCILETAFKHPYKVDLHGQPASAFILDGNPDYYAALESTAGDDAEMLDWLAKNGISDRQFASYLRTKDYDGLILHNAKGSDGVVSEQAVVLDNRNIRISCAVEI